MPQLHATRVTGKQRIIKSFRLTEETIKGLDRIRALFHAKHPAASYPTCSLVLEKVIVAQLTRLQKPEVLKAEIEDFEKRYGDKLKAQPRTKKPTQLSQMGRGQQVKNTPPR